MERDVLRGPTCVDEGQHCPVGVGQNPKEGGVLFRELTCIETEEGHEAG